MRINKKDMAMNMNIYSWSLEQFKSFLIIFIRVSFILLMMPILNSRALPILPKIGLVLMTSIILLPVLRVNPSFFPSDPLLFALFLLGEAMIGFLLGISIHLIFIGVQFAGELIGNQMGFGMANILDPQSGLNSPVISQFQYFVAVMIFLSIDGHHWFFRALAQSFQILSPGEIFLQGGLFKHFVDLSGKVFQIGIKIIAPIMAILIFTQLALGIVARMVPQINLLISSFPLTIGLGLIVLGLSLEFLFPLIRSLFEHSGKNLVNVILPLMKR